MDNDPWLECDEGFVRLDSIRSLTNDAWYKGTARWVALVRVGVDDPEVHFKVTDTSGEVYDTGAKAKAAAKVMSQGLLRRMAALRVLGTGQGHVDNNGDGGTGGNTQPVGEGATPAPGGVAGGQPADDGSPVGPAGG